jgi:hypothetical protein
MILEKQKEANVLVDGLAQQSIQMSLDLDSAQILMQMLSKNLYSDSVGSAIRECASNALDSHRRAGVTDPIIVAFKPSAHNTYEFSVEDFGIGLDDDDVKSIISKYGKSTKRDSATELGMMGLGFKAPLAYSSSFYFVCRKNGVERKYMMYEGEDTNTIDLLYEKETEERNGVKIIIPVNYSDKRNFLEKIKEQLCYFENVYFDVPEDSSINNEFIITRHNDFQFSEMSTDSKMHLCLDDVYYPIDFNKLNITPIEFPIALRFSLTDGIFPTPNREAIRYTPEAKQIILKKISDVADYFVNKYNESVLIGNDIKSVINYYENSGHYITLQNGLNQRIDSIMKHAMVTPLVPKIKDVDVLDFKKLYKHYKVALINPVFAPKYFLRYKRMTDMTKSYVYSYSLEKIINKEAKVYVYSNKLPGIKKDYIRTLHSENVSVFFLKKEDEMVLGHPSKHDNSTYYHLLSLKDYSKSDWRTVINEYKHVVSLISESFISVDDLVVPQWFIDAKKKVKPTSTSDGSGDRRKKLKGEIVGKDAHPLQKWSDGRNCKFTPVTYKLEKLETSDCLKIYAHHDDYLKLDALYGLIGKQKIELVTFSERELKIVNSADIHNMMSLEEFMKGESAPFKRMVTAALIKSFMNQWRCIFGKLNQLEYTNSVLANKLKALVDYVNKNYFMINYSGGLFKSETLISEMIKFAEEKNLFDPNIYPEYVEAMNFLNKFPFLETFFLRCGHYTKGDDCTYMLNCLFKHHKQRINIEHYKKQVIQGDTNVPL